MTPQTVISGRGRDNGAPRLLGGTPGGSQPVAALLALASAPTSRPSLAEAVAAVAAASP